MGKRAGRWVGVAAVSVAFGLACGSSEPASGPGSSTAGSAGSAGRGEAGGSNGGGGRGGAGSGGQAGTPPDAGPDATAGASSGAGPDATAGSGGQAGASGGDGGDGGDYDSGGSGGAAGAAESGCTPHVRWARDFGDPDSQLPDALVMDEAGNVTVSGTFSGSINFGGNTLLGSLNGDVFIARFDPEGHHLVSLRFGADVVPDTAFGLAVDKQGAMIVTGYVSGPIDFGGGLLPAENANRLGYVAKFDASGKYVFAHRLDALYAGEGDGVTTDANDNVIGVGVAAADSNFGSGPDPVGGGYVVKYAPDGKHLWTKHFSGASPHDVRSDAAGNLVVTGYVLGSSVNFGGGPRPGTGSPANADVFLLGLDENGNYRYDYRFVGPGADMCKSVAVDALGRSFIAGSFEDTVDFGGGPLTSAGGLDGFWASYDASGKPRFSKRFGDPDYQSIWAVAGDRAGNSAVIGGGRGSFDFGGPLIGQGLSGLFFARFDPNGNHLCSRMYPAGVQVSPRAVGLNASSVALTGGAYSALDFGSGPLPYQGGYDVFVAVIDF